MKTKKMIKWIFENDFRIFAVVCEVCAVIFTVWACCCEKCFFRHEIAFLFALPFLVWAGEKLFVFLLALGMTIADLFEKN